MMPVLLSLATFCCSGQGKKQKGQHGREKRTEKAKTAACSHGGPVLPELRLALPGQYQLIQEAPPLTLVHPNASPEVQLSTPLCRDTQTIVITAHSPGMKL